MLERILRKIILLFYQEWNNDTTHSFMLISLMLCLFIINILLNVNFFIALFNSFFIYVALLFINGYAVKEEREIKNKEHKPLNITFLVYLLLFAFDVWFSTQFPLLVFNSEYSIWWFIFYTIPVFTTSCFSTYFMIKSLKEETDIKK